MCTTVAEQSSLLSALILHIASGERVSIGLFTSLAIARCAKRVFASNDGEEGEQSISRDCNQPLMALDVNISIESDA